MSKEGLSPSELPAEPEVESTEDTTETERVDELYTLPLPEACFEDENVEEFLNRLYSVIKSDLIQEHITDSPRDELRGVRNSNSGVSKFLFKAMDYAILLKEPEIGVKIMEIAGFDPEAVRRDVWNSFMMSHLHHFGWEYFYEAGRAFGINQQEINDVLLNDIRRELEKANAKTLTEFRLYQEHTDPNPELLTSLSPFVETAMARAYVKGDTALATEFGQTFQVAESVTRAAQQRAIEELLKVKKYEETLALATECAVDPIITNREFQRHYLSLLGDIALTKAAEFKDVYKVQVGDPETQRRDFALINGLENFIMRTRATQWIGQEGYQREIAQLPAWVFQALGVKRQSASLFLRLVKEGKQEANVVAHTLRITPEEQRKFLNDMVVSYLAGATLTESQLTSLQRILDAAPAVRETVHEPRYQEALYQSLHHLLTKGRKVAPYLPLLTPEGQGQLCLAELEQAVRANDQQKFERLAQQVGMTELASSRVSWQTVRRGVKAGFQLPELARFPFLGSRLVRPFVELTKA